VSRDGRANKAAAPVRPADSFLTLALDIPEKMRRDAVHLGGFTHPLFTRPAEVRLQGGSPLPGQAVLLLMAGLVEQSGRMDDAIALLGMSDVRFRRPVSPGSRMHVRVDVIAHVPRPGGRTIREMRWTALDGDGSVLADAAVQLLVSDSGTDEAIAL